MDLDADEAQEDLSEEFQLQAKMGDLLPLDLQKIASGSVSASIVRSS